MKKNLLATIFLLSILYGCSERNGNNDPLQSLEDTKWKLVGIVDTETGSLKKLEPKDCAECYTLVFDTDSMASALSIWAIYKLDFNNLYIPRDICKPDNVDSNKPCLDAERYAKDGVIYEDSYDFRYGIVYAESYEVISEELKLFFSHLEHRYYLLFNRF